MTLYGEGEYNLNVLKQIKITDSYLGLDQNVRGCQNDISFTDCTTKQYIDTLLDQCGCLPLNIRLNDKVVCKRRYFIWLAFIFRNHFALHPTKPVSRKLNLNHSTACPSVPDSYSQVFQNMNSLTLRVQFQKKLLLTTNTKENFNIHLN